MDIDFEYYDPHDYDTEMIDIQANEGLPDINPSHLPPGFIVKPEK